MLLLWISELNIPTISLILKNVHIESAIIIYENFHKIFQVRDIYLCKGEYAISRPAFTNIIFSFFFPPKICKQGLIHLFLSDFFLT